MGLAVALMHERSLGTASRRAAAAHMRLARGAAAVRCVRCRTADARACLAAAARWAPYLATLPAREALPVTWHAAALRRLQGTDLPESIASDRKRLRAQWEAHVKPLTAAHPVAFPAAAFGHAAYVAARSLTASRGFAVDNFHGEGMVPLADLFNHSPAEDVHFTVRMRAAMRACRVRVRRG